MRVVFSIPEKVHNITFSSNTSIPRHLVYIEWYTSFADSPNHNHLLYDISPLQDQDGGQICSVIPLANIHRSIHLFPKFGPSAPQDWTSSNVLDLCDTFFVNSFTDKHLYRLLCYRFMLH